MSTTTSHATSVGTCSIRSIKYRCSQKVVIEDFSFYQTKSTEHPVVTSLDFFPPQLPNLKFRVSIYPTGVSVESEAYVSVYLRQIKSEDEKEEQQQKKVIYQFKFSILDKSNEKIFTKGNNICFKEAS